MTAVSFQMQRGVDGFKMSDVTVGAAAPTSLDFEFRYQVLDANSKNMNDWDIVRAIKAMIRWLETNGTTATAITTQPSGPPN
jgi:hypothetical protein